MAYLFLSQVVNEILCVVISQKRFQLVSMNRVHGESTKLHFAEIDREERRLLSMICYE